MSRAATPTTDRSVTGAGAFLCSKALAPRSTYALLALRRMIDLNRSIKVILALPASIVGAPRAQQPSQVGPAILGVPPNPYCGLITE